MPVYWSIRAQRHLEEAMAEQSCLAWAQGGATASPGVLKATRDHLDAMLEDVFEQAVVFVKDQVIGYRRKKDLFILLVEVFGAGGVIRSGPYVVKIGPEVNLTREYQGWGCCQPAGLHHDLVLLGLEDRKPPRSFDGRSWKCLIYGDAQQVLGVNITVTFEDAALQCIRHGLPTLSSVVAVINVLYERIGHLFYSRAYVDDPRFPPPPDPNRSPPLPAGPRHVVLDGPHFDDNLERWRTDPSCVAVRNDVGSAIVGGAGQYLDPIDYFRYVQRFVAHVVTRNGEPADQPAIGPGARTLPGLATPTPIDLIPRTLRGCAHGDLHGRNILVGIVHDDAMWPTVFDYEDMGPSNAIVWDFVKFETELKIRAYHHVFAGLSSSKYAQAIQEFEVEVNKQTEDCHLHQRWTPGGDPRKKEQEERLRTILLAIRRLAAQHLGVNHGRPNDWLEEYYFLLAGYGVATSRFENLQHRERVGALVSAGVAAARLSWPRQASKSLGL